LGGVRSLCALHGHQRNYLSGTIPAVPDVAREPGLPAVVPVAILPTMFMVTEEDAAAIRAMFEQDGELSAAVELRRRFPGITDNAKARECVRTIAGWRPPSPLPAKVVRLRPRG
jgi:hypothetical protein